ncbi:MAG: DUF2914 domain-containing protein [Gammaproteobacteria bacterium]|nr:DUF2914 domain-containing protein [Gammaproteobacteria bacterium]
MLRFVMFFVVSLFLSPSFLIAAESADAKVMRAIFTPGVKDFEPMGSSNYFYTTCAQLYFFTELYGFKGQVLKHRWFYNDKMVSEVKVTVRSHLWRASTKKSLPKSWVGDWRAEVVNAAGVVLASKHFEYRNLPY